MIHPIYLVYYFDNFCDGGDIHGQSTLDTCSMLEINDGNDDYPDNDGADGYCKVYILLYLKQRVIMDLELMMKILNLYQQLW